MQDLEELLVQMADARKIYGNELVAPYHGGNRVFGSEHGLPHQDTVENERG